MQLIISRTVGNGNKNIVIIIRHYSNSRCYVSQRCRLLSSHASMFDSATGDHRHTNYYSNDNNVSSFASGPLHDRYYQLVSSDTIDPIQIRTLQSLERLRYELSQHPPPPPPIDSPTSATAATMMTQNTTLKDSLSKFTNWFGLPVPSSFATTECDGNTNVDGYVQYQEGRFASRPQRYGEPGTHQHG